MAMQEGLPVPGYRPQPDERVALVSENKITEERILRAIERDAENGLLDRRWAAIAKTHFEEGFMALNRAVFQPSRVKLPEDDR